MPIGLARGTTANEARLGEILGEVGVDKLGGRVPVGLGLFDEGLGELIWCTLGVDLDERPVRRVLLLVKCGIFGGCRDLLFVDDLLTCGASVSVLWPNRGE
jgi:hypothetical protein